MATKGLSDAGGSALIPDSDISQSKPDHLGHRERLRERFLAAPDALPDYELLELVLFALPRVDTKPIAKELIRKFVHMYNTQETVTFGRNSYGPR